jgi:hypothetical protein
VTVGGVTQPSRQHSVTPPSNRHSGVLNNNNVVKRKTEPQVLTQEQIDNDYWLDWDDSHISEIAFIEEDSESSEEESSEEVDSEADVPWPNWNDCHPDEIAFYFMNDKSDGGGGGGILTRDSQQKNFNPDNSHWDGWDDANTNFDDS